MVCDSCTLVGLRKLIATLNLPFPFIIASGVMRANCLRVCCKFTMQRVPCTDGVQVLPSVTVVSCRELECPKLEAGCWRFDLRQLGRRAAERELRARGASGLGFNFDPPWPSAPYGFGCSGSVGFPTM